MKCPEGYSIQARTKASEVVCTSPATHPTLHRSSADNLSVKNQTNLAIKGIIAIEAMSKMSSVVNQAADEPLRPMEEACVGQRPAYPCSVRAKQLVDFGLQFICGRVAGHQLGGIIGRCLWLLVS